MKIYVAGASADMGPPRWAMDAVRKEGHEITLDWIEAIEKAGAANEGLSVDDQRRYAVEDLEAVERADLVWVVTPESRAHGCGLWVELGAALVTGRRVIVSGPQASRSIFAALGETFPLHDQALDRIREHAAIHHAMGLHRLDFNPVHRMRFVAFWDSFGNGAGSWVAGTCRFNSVAQGETLPKAVDNLTAQLCAEATYAKEDGVTAFEVLHKSHLPLEQFIPTGEEKPLRYSSPNKDARYWADVVVFPDNATAALELTP